MGKKGVFMTTHNFREFSGDVYCFFATFASTIQGNKTHGKKENRKRSRREIGFYQ